MLDSAKELMLGGREPTTKEDWETVMNFFAANILEEVALDACLLIRTIYDMPLSDTLVAAIVEFQLDLKKEAVNG